MNVRKTQSFRPSVPENATGLKLPAFWAFSSSSLKSWETAFFQESKIGLSHQVGMLPVTRIRSVATIPSLVVVVVVDIGRVLCDVCPQHQLEVEVGQHDSHGCQAGQKVERGDERQGKDVDAEQWLHEAGQRVGGRWRGRLIGRHGKVE